MKPFVIVGMPRTGSTLLATGLGYHPDVRCYGELFHASDSERKGAHAIVRGTERIWFSPESDEAVEFLKKNVFNEENAEYGAVGFKLFGEFVRGPGSDRLFARLQGLPDLNYVHIERSNYLDILVSRRMAEATGDWVKYSGTTQAKPVKRKKANLKLRLDPAGAEGFFKSMEEMNAFYRSSFFPKDRYIRVLYDVLERDFSEEMNRVFAFLGVRALEVAPGTEKQRSRKVAEVVENYDELAEHFAGGPFEGFFAA